MQDCLSKKIVGVVKHYEWGSLNNDSSVLKIYNKNFKDDKNNQKPMAEYWLGTHPSGLANIKTNIQSKPIEPLKLIYELPYLFKILSVAKPLSIQVHPNVQQAVKLHKSNPSFYPDNNSKPEMAIAITTFRMLGGFKNILTILNHVFDITPWYVFAEMKLEKSLPYCSASDLFNMIFLNESESQQLVKDIYDFLQIEKNVNESDKLFLDLYKHYKNDIGCLCAYFLNHLELKPFDSVFIDSGVPHAYLEGDCIECMNCSDNVVRCGLTSKPKDIKTLLEIIDYKKQPTKVNPLIDTQFLIRTFKTICPEFKLDIFSTENEEMSLNQMGYFESSESPSILFTLKGKFQIQVTNNQRLESHLLEENESLITDINTISLLYGQGIIIRCTSNL